MLVVKVEIWPYGKAQDAKELGRLYIANTGNEDSINSSYIAGQELNQIFVPDRDTIKIPSHTRSRGFWPLVKQAVSRLVAKKGL